jgi:CheY-like chemotaxis protein
MLEKNGTVLVVEDSSDDAQLIHMAFRKAGFDNQLQTVDGPENAIRYLKGEGQYSDRKHFPIPAFVLLDHEMPGDGWLVLHWVRRESEISTLPVVVFTGSINPHHEKNAMEAGANAYYRKPQGFREFVDMIKKIGERWLGKGGFGARDR